MTNLVERKD